MFWPFELFGGFAIIAFVLAIATTIIWIWALVDCLQNPRIQGTEKLVWVLVILFLHILGALIYFLVGRQQRMLGS
jgi:NADH:ubiquinone oxidoreductase subunit 6 (subunit J)